MSLEKAIQKLTQVIQAATPAPGTPGPALDAPFGREAPATRKPKCILTIDGQQVFNPYISKNDPNYCKCYKEANPGFTGPCYFNCRTITFKPYPSLSQDQNVKTLPECQPDGIEGVA